VKIGLLQLNATVGDFSGNSKKLLEAYRKACAQGAELVVASELFLCGYPSRDLFLREDFISSGLDALQKLAREIDQVPLCVGYADRNPQRPGKALLNAAAYLHQREVKQRIFKTLLPTYEVFDEGRYFEPASKVEVVKFGGRKIGFTICEDIWNDQDFWPERLYRRDPVKELISAGADLIINLSASPWRKGLEKTRLEMLRKVARDEKLPLVLVNQVGANDELIFDGHSVALNSKGEILALAAAFKEDLLVVDLEAKPAHSGELKWPEENELIFNALCLGVRDYVDKCGFRTVVLGLSGGIDSTLVATIAARALGPENVLGVSMPSKYSSSGSLSDAAALVKNLGIRHETIPIDVSVASVEGQLVKIFAGKAADITEENIQSRLRGVILMALSNKFGSLVLTTGNKSELAVGYSTIYGDMSGGISVISDVLKTEVYALARWINREREIIPKNSIAKPPSAELRPNQTDQDSLPPYDILDAIIDRYIVREISLDAIIADGFAPEVVRDVINKINFSEYKRRQAAPGLRISARAFGVGRRIPVAQRFRS
jgi:NAD+ synthase (glutamine-hydrolysing)